MENNETAPMIRVKNMPNIISKGKDQQVAFKIEKRSLPTRSN